MPETPIQIVACTIPTSSTLYSSEFSQLPLPEDWHPLLCKIEEERQGKSDVSVTIPIRSLNSVIHGVIPQLLTAPKAGMRSRNESNQRERTMPPWLIAKAPLSTEKIWFIIQAWLEKTYSDCPSFEMVKRQLRLEDLTWEPVKIALNERPPMNGTAVLPPLAFDAFPAFIAARLIERNVYLPVGSHMCSLLRVPIQDGTELMTWPPVPMRVGKQQTWWYSYVVTIKLHTFVGISEPHVHFHYSVRRWRSSSCIEDGKLQLGHHTSVYLHLTRPWLGLPYTYTCSVATLEATMRGDQRTTRWTNRVPEIFKRSAVGFPLAEELIRDPAKWLQGVNGVQAGIVYVTPRYHPIGTGIGPDVCEALTNAIMKGLGEDAIQCPPLSPISMPQKRSKHFLERDLREISVKDRLAGFVESVGSSATIEVVWRTEAVRDMLVDRIVAEISLPRPPLPPRVREDHNLAGQSEDTTEEKGVEDRLFEVQEVSAETKRLPRRRRVDEAPPEPAYERDIPLPGGRLRIRIIHVGTMDDPFPELGEKRRQSIQRYTEERVYTIKEQMGLALEPTLTLFELPNYKDPRKPRRRHLYRGRDPQSAIRLGMASTGRVVQFITNTEDNLRERCKASVRDGLRHLGYLPVPIGYQLTSGPQLPENLLVAAVWVVRLTRKRSWAGVYLPVVVLFHVGKQKVEAWLPGKGVRPFREALLEVTTMNPDQVKQRRREEALGELRVFIQTQLMKQGSEDVLILTMAQNIRDIWPGLNNDQVILDKLRFERNGTAFPANTLRGRLRLLRLRTSMNEETPEWYIPGAGPNNFTQGMWFASGATEEQRIASRMLYLIGSKPHTMAGSRKGKQKKPRERYAIPSILECLTVLLQEDDDPLVWPNAIYQWRKMSYVTNDDTLLPLPLEFAKKVEDYARVIGPWVFPDEWDQENEEEVDVDGMNEDKEEEEG